jgi:lysophospholipase L1-like esterase
MPMGTTRRSRPWPHPHLVVLAGLLMVSGALTIGPATPSTAGAAPRTTYYLSLGDSLVQGYQPGVPNGSETLHGYPNRLVVDVAKTYRLTLENYGCGGATSSTILYTDGCRPGGLANDGVHYPDEPQATAAIAFIKAHRGHIGLITISIGWNDFDSCVGMTAPAACVGATLPAIRTNLLALSTQLRAAAGSSTPIVATTYSDPDLADWLEGSTGKEAARAWITELRDEVNPTFVNAYAHAKVKLIDLTAAYGTYVPWSKVVDLAPYGRIPFAVAQICKLSWMCRIRNEEASSQGYALIASEIAKYYLHR